MTSRSPSTDTWRHPGERAELVERVIKAEKRALIAETRARAATADDPRDEVTNLMVRIVELEDIVSRLNGTIAQLNQRRSA